MEVDDEGRIVGFEEKPLEPKTIPGTTDCLASMGDLPLRGRLPARIGLTDDLLDFGKDVIPALVRQGEPVYAYDFTERNISSRSGSTLQHEGVRQKELVPGASDSRLLARRRDARAVLAGEPRPGASPGPKFNVYGERFPLFAAPGHFPPAKFVHEDAGANGRRR